MRKNLSCVVRQATLADLELLVPLFDAYRQFYRQPSDLDLARRFLLQRLDRHESVILLAFENGSWAMGFTQLFPSFSSVSAARILILNDLFVTPDAATELLPCCCALLPSLGARRGRFVLH